MTVSLTEAEFSQHVNTKFRINLDAETVVDLQLVEVKGYMSESQEQQGMERFSIYFQGPGQPLIQQGTYQVQHDRMGEFDLFVVPIAKNDAGFRYEAVFNYRK